ncbi:MAG: adenylate/guanylate cyclase domain-containing protein [Kiloniellales bacterium]|nr:adenylate/guanylate cyclase domain-containing protein [Kiloniellales bacterium]
MLGRTRDRLPGNNHPLAKSTAKVLHAGSRSGTAIQELQHVASRVVSPVPCRVPRSVVFADFADYSRLTDHQLRGFLELLANVGDSLNAVRTPESYIRSMGDGIFAVTLRADEAIKLALTLNRAVEEGNLSVSRLEVAMQVRIALHAGPVILARDPVTGSPGYYGRNVTRAARLENVTAPGRIYATREFVECLEREAPERTLDLWPDDSGWRFKYLGVVALPKNFGSQSVFEVRTSRRAS